MLILATIILFILLSTTNWRSVSSVEKIKRKNLGKKSGNIKLVSAIVGTYSMRCDKWIYSGMVKYY